MSQDFRKDRVSLSGQSLIGTKLDHDRKSN